MTTIDAPRPPTTEPPGLPETESPIRLKRVDSLDVITFAAGGLSAFCLAWLAYERLTPLSGALGFSLCWYMLFVVISAFVLRDLHGWVRAKDKLAALVITTSGAVVVAALVLIVGFTTIRGIQVLRLGFLTRTLDTTGPLAEASEGGGAHALVGTIEQVGLAVLMSVPLAIATALFLNEIGGRWARPVRLIVDAMSAVPSIVAGLFIYAVLILGVGMSASGFLAALALSVLMLPTVTRTAEVVLRLVPGGLREGALALGGTEWRMARLVILPTARTGLVTAVILGVARAVGETAPLLLTAGSNKEMNWNPFVGPQEALPTFVYNQIRSSSNSSVTRAWTGALVLLLLVLILFVIARALGNRAVGARTASLRLRRNQPRRTTP